MTASTVPGYPFTAIVGQDDLRLALLLTAISPGIGGVIVRGEKGTAKTTTVRALAPHLSGRLVNLPLGATEDRVVGSIDIETVLTTGHATVQKGLLSEADGGLLYVDEVNLLPDHLVDVLLDAASTGRITIERDGVSQVQDTSFVLVGTMNPEEGELRPQLLDRFGLAVDVVASREPSVRAQILRSRLSYEDDPVGFVSNFADDESELGERLGRAMELLGQIELDDTTLGRIATLCSDFDVDGMRADLVIARTARAHAAWRIAADGGDLRITDEDIRIAALFALPHRRRRDPFDEPGINEDQLDDALDHARNDFPDEQPEDPEEPEYDDSADPEQTEQQQIPDGTEAEKDTSSDEQAPTQAGGRAAQGAPFLRS